MAAENIMEMAQLEQEDPAEEVLQDDDRDNLVFHDPTDTEMDAQKITILTVLTISTVAMLVGNTLSICIILRSRNLRKHTYYWLVLNLNVLDLLNSMIVLPLNIIWEYNGFWPFNQMLCDFEIFFDTGFSCIAAYSTVLLSLDKYVYITKPFLYHQYIGPKMTIGSILVTWGLWLTYSASSVFGGLARSNKEYKYIYVLDNCNFVLKNNYAITHFAITFFFPLVILLFTSTKIICLARRHIKKIHAENHSVDTPMQSSLDISTGSQPEKNGKKSSPDIRFSFSGKNQLAPEIPLTPVGSSSSPANSEGSTANHTDTSTPNSQRKAPSKSMTKTTFKALGTVTIVVFAYIVMFAPFCLAAVINVGCACVKPFVFEDYLAVFYYMHSLVNPYIYMSTDRRYKKAIRRITAKVQWCRSCRPVHQSTHNTYISSSNH